MSMSIAVVTVQEMARLEQWACSDGASEKQFMENAGQSIAALTEHFIEENFLPRTVSLIVGKGNNGGDAFAAGLALLDKGFSVTAWHIFPVNACSALCQEMRQRFQKKGGVIHPLAKYRPVGVILDGLVGTGFKGKAEGVLAQAIEETNAADLPILAIDIPSGLNGTSGAVKSVAIRATQTLFLELPKIGFFINKGWDHVGTLAKAEFGLDHKYKEKAQAAAHLLDPSNVILPPIKRTRHKYEAGYVLACAGSKEMPGAAILASYAALLAGAGIVRLFHFKHMAAELSSAPVELIKEEWDGKSVGRIHAECMRAKALLIGPGIGRSKAAQAAIKKVLTFCTLPAVIDADALYFLSEHPKWDLHPHSILTPHRGEMHMLLSSFRAQGHDPIQSYVDHKKTTLVLKGAPTFIFHENATPIIVARGDPGMATAGAGDVLTGMIAAMLAQGLAPLPAACAAVTLHALAGEIGASHLTSYCLTASKILEFIPDAFHLVHDYTIRKK